MTDTYTYDAFGATKSHVGVSANEYRFTGELQDAQVARGLYYLRARYYDPALGRFLSRDPLAGLIGLPQSLNRYVYALNNPVNLIDPTGLQTPAAAGAVVLICGAASGGTCTVAIGVGILGTVAVGTCVATECYEVIGDAVGSGMDVVVQGAGNLAQGAGNLASAGWEHTGDVGGGFLGRAKNLVGDIVEPLRGPIKEVVGYVRGEVPAGFNGPAPGPGGGPGWNPLGDFSKIPGWAKVVGGTTAAAVTLVRLGIMDLINSLLHDKESKPMGGGGS